MTQEEHWKKAFNDLRQKIADEYVLKSVHDKTVEYYKEETARVMEAAGKIQSRREAADKLIDQMESLLFFIHDDIRSSLALDTVSRIDHTLRLIKEYQYGPQKAKGKK